MVRIDYDITDSTNLRAKEYIKQNGCDSLLVTTNGQTEGRGRQGKSFYSPCGEGLYMSYATTVVGDTVGITTSACVAVARAIKSVCGIQVDIKWVNDLYLNGKKVCGILCEAVTDFKSGKITHVIIGIGINLTTARFPDDIKNTAGSLGVDCKENLITEIVNNLKNITSDNYIDYYREHLLGIGKQITYIKNGVEYTAVIKGVDESGGLVIDKDGQTLTLTSGEISLKLN